MFQDVHIYQFLAIDKIHKNILKCLITWLLHHFSLLDSFLTLSAGLVDSDSLES